MTSPIASTHVSVPTPLRLGFTLEFEELYSRAGAIKLDGAFLDFLGDCDAALRARLEAGRAAPEQLPRKQESELLIAIAPYIEDFVAKLFGIEAEAEALAARHNELAPLWSVKRLFVQRRAANRIKPEEAATFDGPALEAQLVAEFGEPFSELAFARNVVHWQQDEEANAIRLQLAQRYAAWAVHTAGGCAQHKRGVLFKAPEKLDFMRLVPVQTESRQGFTVHRLQHLRRREGFELTDPGMDLAARSIRRTTASSATTRARIPAHRLSARRRPEGRPARSRRPSSA